jgi:uncharacterized protein (TIRG00374 family)
MRIALSPTLLRKAERWGITLTALTVVVTLAFTFMSGGENMAEQLHNLPWLGLLWLFLATVAESILRFWRYHVAAQSLKIRVPILRMAYYYTIGYAFIPTPGKVGTAIRLWFLKQNHKLPYRRTAPLIVMDLVSDTLALCTLAAISLAIIDDPRLQTIGWIIGLSLVAATTLALSGPMLLRSLMKTLFRLVRKRKPRLFARILLLLQTAREILGFKTLLTTTMLSLAGWGMVGIAIGNLVTDLGTPIGAAEGSLAISLATMGGFLTMMPAGVGGAEVTMAGIFTLFGVPLVQAVLATALIRLIVLWLTVILGLILLPMAMRQTRHHS